MEKLAKFNIGDIVVHNIQGYRAQIIDIDPLFQASGHYNPAAIRKGMAERKPWYRLLIDDSEQMTYVEECYLELDSQALPIQNPKVAAYLNKHGKPFHPLN